MPRHSRQKQPEGGTLVVRVDGKVTVHILDVLQHLLKNVEDVIPHYGTNVQPCYPSCNNVQCRMYALLPSSPHLRTPANGYWLDTYYWTYTMPGSARTCSWATGPLSGQRPKKTAPGQISTKYPLGPYVKYVPSIPIHLQSCLPMVTDCTLTT